MNDKTKENLKILELENKIAAQAKEITELKKLVIELGEKVFKDKEKKLPEKFAYSERNIGFCDSESYWLCVVCEKRPAFNHHLKLRTCSVKCSAIIEEMLTGKSEKKK